MRKFLVAFAVLGTFAMVANANDITFYFGRPETVGTVTTDFVASSAAPLTVTPGTYTMGVWANVGYQADTGNMDAWNGISMEVVGDAGVSITGAAMNNFDQRVSPGTAYRWESSSDFGHGNGWYLVSVTRFGLGGLWTPAWGMGMGSTDWWSYTDGGAGGIGPGSVNRYWLGNITLSCTDTHGLHNVYFQIGTGGIARSGGSVTGDWIYFGEDDHTGAHGNQFGWTSPLPDFTFTPEPASLILLSLAGLFLRRR